VTCPSSMSKTVKGDGCCVKSKSIGLFNFKPLGNGITSGYTKVTMTNKSSLCTNVGVKAFF